MSIIMGLGNPGPDYAGNRHNIGFWSVAQLAKRLGVRLRRQGQSMSAEGMLAGYPVVLATPRTFMNRSGRAARELLERHRKKPEDLVVLHDEVDLVLGKIRIKQAGGHGGHNGLRSIIEVTGTREFLRIRLGVGRPEDRDDDLADWVLSDFAKGEGSTARELAERGADAVETVLTAGVEEAMNHYHVPSSEGRARNDS